VTTPTTPAVVYRRAADILEIRGWTQGTNEYSGMLCLGAAINAADDRSYGAFSEDLMEPLAKWLTANRADQTRQVLSIIYSSDTVDDIMAGALRSSSGDSRGLAIVQAWNDWRSNFSRTVESPRTRDEVLTALREAATAMDVPAEDTEG
jgi:hypothetical protein